MTIPGNADIAGPPPLALGDLRAQGVDEVVIGPYGFPAPRPGT